MSDPPDTLIDAVLAFAGRGVIRAIATPTPAFFRAHQADPVFAVALFERCVLRVLPLDLRDELFERS
jgi:hypothetical protein